MTSAADFSPILGPVAEVEGLVLDCGWLYGFAGAPAGGMLLAEAIVAGRVPALAAPFSLERLREGRLIRESSLVVDTGGEGVSESGSASRSTAAPCAGIAGQSIGAALHAAGIRVLSTSAKYHRPRGLYCVAGACPSCSVPC